jgi:hypothetical protein
MATIDGMLLEIGHFTENANSVKMAVLNQLRNDKVIDDKQLKHYSEEWQMIVVKKGWFQKITSKDKGEWQYSYVKLQV